MYCQHFFFFVRVLIHGREGYVAIEGYDKEYSEWFDVPKSIKRTSVKPSGSVSLLAGATPGMHWPLSEYYLRRVRISKQSRELLKPFEDAGYVIEDANEDPTGITFVARMFSPQKELLW